MQRIAKFHKVSLEQFNSKYNTSISDVVLKNIKLPQRATRGSAGYDFFAPFDIVLNPGQSIEVPTGIKVEISQGWYLAVFPLRGLGFKYRLQLDNTTGIIDGDYINSANEGHIILKITNDTHTNETVKISTGTAFAQGVFMEYGITINDDVFATREGELDGKELTV